MKGFFRKLDEFGFVHRRNGVFSKKVSLGLLYWISIDESLTNRKALIGCIFTDLIKAIYRLTEITSAPAKRSFPLSWGPPAFSKEVELSDAHICSADQTIKSWMAFLSANDDLDDVTSKIMAGTLFSWNKMQVVSAGLSLLGRCNELSVLKNSTEYDEVIEEFMDAAIKQCKSK